MPKRWRPKLLALLALAVFAGLYLWHPDADPTVLLWPQGAPGAVGSEPEDKPKLHVYLPPRDKATGTAVIICPGGGYMGLAIDNEGRPVAHWLNSLGVAAFVLEYRIAPRYRYPAPMQDAARAIRFVRYHRADYQLKSDRIGIMGFSAGGHLAAITAIGLAVDTGLHPDPIDGISARPNFAILSYPVISMLPPFAHRGSVQSLLGPSPSETELRALSADLNVTPSTPPVFIFTASTDKVVPAENSALFYMALKEAGVPAELHIFSEGAHGAGLADGRYGTPNIPAFAYWRVLAEHWMQERGLIN